MRLYWAFLLSASTALVACGDDDSAGRLADAPPQSDAYVEPDTTVTLTVTYDGAPRAGVHTYFLAPDNTVVATVDTNASGVASAKLPLGGSVTAIDPFPRRVEALRAAGPGRAAAVEVGDNDLRSFLGVKPGDHLTLTDKTTPDGASFQLYAPVPTQGSISDYSVFTNCGNGNLYPGGGGSGSGSPDPGGYVFLRGCNGKADIVVVASGLGADEQQRALGVLVKADAALKEDELIDLRDLEYATPTERTFTYSNNTHSLQVEHTLVTPKGTFGPFVPDAGFESVATIGEPVLAGATSIVDTQVQTDNNRYHVIDAGAVTASYMLDLSNLLPRAIQSVAEYNVATKKLTWTEADDGAAADLSIAQFGVSNEARSWQWTLVAPYARGELVPPVLPTDVATWTPADGDNVYVLSLLNAKATGQYDAVRARALDAFTRSRNDGFTSFAVPSGRITTVQYYQLGVAKPAAQAATVRRAAKR